MMTFGLLLMSFLLIFLAYQQKAIFEKNLLDFDFCTDELPSIYWGSHEDLPEFLDLVRDKSKDNGAAGAKSRGAKRRAENAGFVFVNEAP